MAKPVLNNIPAWDASIGTTITFSYSGNQVYKNRLVVREKTSGLIEYDKTQANLSSIHIIPSNQLTNGVEYTAQVQVTDRDGNTSVFSNTVKFICLTTPTLSFTFDGVENSILNSYVTARLNYEQRENEPVSCYRIRTLSNGSEIFDSGLCYDNNLSAYITNLLDNTQYTFEGYIETTNGFIINISTTKDVDYDSPYICSVLNTENNKETGEIKVYSYIRTATGESHFSSGNPIFEEFTDNNEITSKWIIVPHDGSYIEYDNNTDEKNGFVISDDFVLKLKVKKIMLNTPFFRMSNDNGDEITLTFKTMTDKHDIEWIYVEVLTSTYTNNFTLYNVVKSNNDILEGNCYLTLWLCRKEGFMECKITDSVKRSLA